MNSKRTITVDAEPYAYEFEPARCALVIIDMQRDFLEPGGHLILEIGATQDAAVRKLFAARPGFAVAPTVRDGAGLPRVIVAKWT